MNTGNSSDNGPSFYSPRRSDTIPENTEATVTPVTITTGGTNTNTNTGMATAAAAAADNASIEELLMRHSSPLFHRSTGAAVTSPLAERNSSPSPLRLNRPRSNPRSRTPMRIPEEQEGQQQQQQQHPPLGRTTRTSTTTTSATTAATTEGRRITIRLGVGSGVGTNTASYASRRTRHEPPVRAKSKKQGPSHRKVRRWNNSNFVNLAAELSSSSKGSASTAAAVEALLKGSAEASKHRSILDPKQLESGAMKQFREDGSLRLVREQFFEGSLPGTASSSSSKRKVVTDHNLLTPVERFHRIEARLRRIVVKACENSYAASKVVNTLEDFLVRVYHNGEEDRSSREEWQEFLLDAPTVTTSPRHREQDSEEAEDEGEDATNNRAGARRTTTFLFDADSSTGGFHRLLLHGVCQFHCLNATSSTMSTMSMATGVNGKKKARVLTATGTFSGADVRLVDFITERQQERAAAAAAAAAAGTSTNTRGSSTQESLGGNKSTDQILSNKLSGLTV